MAPRMLACNFSTGSLRSASALGLRSAAAVGGLWLMGRVPSFSENQFTVVLPNSWGESPTHKPKSKQGQVVSDSLEGGQPRKSARMPGKGADASYISLVYL